jgi:chromosome segregation ATPase
MSRVSDESELDRLRGLVGPSETSYAELRADRNEAQRVARDAVAELGELRGHIVELNTQVSRARQDQDLLQRRIEMTGWERLIDRVHRRWTMSVLPRLKRRR